MPTLQVRDLPQDLYEKLKAKADAEHRSLAQETIVAIEAYLFSLPLRAEKAAVYGAYDEDYLGREARIAKRKALFEEISRAPKIEIPDDFPNVVELIREDRDSR